MKKYLLAIIITCVSVSLFAQEAETTPSPWSCSGVIGLNASATGLVNWAAGGNNNINGVAFGKVRLLYSEDNLAWETNLNLEYGMSYIDQKGDAFQKSSDVIDFRTKFGWQFHKAWYLAASAGFKSQFAFGRAYDGTDAADPIISKFLSPSYTDISVGIDWKPNSIFSLYLSPVAGQITTAYVGGFNMRCGIIHFCSPFASLRSLRFCWCPVCRLPALKSLLHPATRKCRPPP